MTAGTPSVGRSARRRRRHWGFGSCVMPRLPTSRQRRWTRPWSAAPGTSFARTSGCCGPSTRCGLVKCGRSVPSSWRRTHRCATTSMSRLTPSTSSLRRRWTRVQSAGDRPKPWGTGQAVLCACGEVGGAFGVINADDFYGRRSYELLAEELRKDHEDHVAVGFRLRDTLSTHGGVSRGLCIVEDGYLTGVRELHDVRDEDGEVVCEEGVDLTGDESVSVNLWGFR